MIIFELKPYNHHAERLITSLKTHGVDATEGSLDTKRFSDGEVYHRIATDVKNQDVVLVGSLEKDGEFMEMFDLACAMVKYGARTLNFVIPYFGYSTMERAVKEGEVVKAKTRARLFSSVPLAHQGNNIFLMDLHVESMVHYFEGNLHSIHLSAIPDLLQEVKKSLKEENITNFIVASADTGRAKAVQKIAQELNCDCAFIVKKREGEKVSAQAVGVECKDKTVLIYDDMIRSGNSIMEAIKVYKNHGAKDVWIITTHGVFTEKNNTQLSLTKKFLTNSHDNHIAYRNDRGTIIDTMPIFAKSLAERILK